MILGIDHVVLAVHDLAAAWRSMEERLGLRVLPGGIHPGRGTESIIVPFGVDALEVTTVRDAGEAQGQQRGRALSAFLQQGEGLAGFAVETDDIAAAIGQAWGEQVPITGASPAARQWPDGAAQYWLTAEVAGDPLGRRLPVLIQHQTPPDERLAPLGNPLGATGITGVTLCTPLLYEAMEAFRRYLHLDPHAVGERRVLFLVGEAVIELATPDLVAAEWPAAESPPEGLFSVTLAVHDIQRAAAVLERAGTPAAETNRGRLLLLDPARTCNLRLRLEPAQS